MANDKRNMKSIKRQFRQWEATPEYKAAKASDAKFWRSERGKELKDDLKTACHTIKKTVKVTKHHIYLAPRHVNKIKRRFEDVGDDMKSLKGAHWDIEHRRVWKKAMKNDQFEDVKDQLQRIGESKAGKNLGAKAKKLGDDFKKHVKISK